MNALPKALVLKLTTAVKSGSETMVPQEMHGFSARHQHNGCRSTSLIAAINNSNTVWVEVYLSFNIYLQCQLLSWLRNGDNTGRQFIRRCHHGASYTHAPSEKTAPSLLTVKLARNTKVKQKVPLHQHVFHMFRV